MKFREYTEAYEGKVCAKCGATPVVGFNMDCKTGVLSPQCAKCQDASFEEQEQCEIANKEANLKIANNILIKMLNGEIKTKPYWVGLSDAEEQYMSGLQRIANIEKIFKAD